MQIIKQQIITRHELKETRFNLGLNFNLKIATILLVNCNSILYQHLVLNHITLQFCLVGHLDM